MTRPAAALIALGCALALAGCGGSGQGSEGESTTTSAAPPETLEALWRGPGEDVAIVAGTSDFGPGTNRVSFLVVDKQSKVIERPTARVWISHGLKQKPYAQTAAKLEPIGVPGGATAEAQNIYVTSVDTPTPGTYWILAEPVGGKKIQALGNLVVRTQAAAPSVGDRAIPSKTPTLEPGVDPKSVTTAEPPDRDLLRTTVAAAMAAKRPFVVTFATPLYCQTRTCGPVVQIDAIGRQEVAGQGCRLHPHRDLQGQRPCERDESLGRRVEAADGAVHVRRRPHRCDPDPNRRRLQPGRARDGCRQGRRLTRGRHTDRKRVAQPSRCPATTLLR